MHMLFAFWFHLPDIQRRGTFPPWLAIILCVAGVAAVGMLYAKEAGRLGFFGRALMASVRMAIVAVVAFLLLRPVMVRDLREERSRPVTILIDVSESMDHKDPR